MQTDQANPEIPVDERNSLVRENEQLAGFTTAVRSHGLIGTQWHAFLGAVQFLTRVPVPERFFDYAQPTIARLQLATIYFPLVGSLIGLTTASVIWLALHLWPTWLAVLIGLAVEALLTGALHEDALADCCDALGGGWTRADVLRILDDSRLGSYGVLGLIVAFSLRAGCIASLTTDMLLSVVVASATIGRWSMVIAMASLAPVPERPSLAQQAGRQRLSLQGLAATFATFPGVVPLALLVPGRLAFAVTVVIVITALFLGYVRKRIGGLTGDCIGAIGYASQIALLLCCAARMGGDSVV